MSTTFSAEDTERPEFWLDLCPGMSIEGDGIAAAAEFRDTDRLISNLRREGYIQVPGVLPERCTAPIRAALAILFQRGIPLPFIYVYDEPWQLFRRLSRMLSAVLGNEYRALPDFWAWYVNPSDDAVGWGAHRDRPLQNTLENDNSPMTLTVWVPLSDATTLNSCMYVLPAHLDGRFAQRNWNGDGPPIIQNLQDIRALPAAAGSVLAWNQSIYHWGSRASDLGESARVSVAFEFQRGDRDPFALPLLDPARQPFFNERIALIGRQILQYRHMYPLTPEVAGVANTLVQRYMPSVALA